MNKIHEFRRISKTLSSDALEKYNVSNEMWSATSHAERDLKLSAANAFELDGYDVFIDTRVTGGDRDSLIKILAVRGSQAIVCKPITNFTKCDLYLLELTDQAKEVKGQFPSLEVTEKLVYLDGNPRAVIAPEMESHIVRVVPETLEMLWSF